MTQQDFAIWIKDNQKRCLNLLRKQFRCNDEIAQDIFQNMCIITLRYISKNYQFTNFKSWFNYGLSWEYTHYNRLNKKYVYDYEFEGSSDNTPEANLLNKDLRHRIDKGIAWLAPKEKEAIVSYYLEEDDSRIGNNTYKVNKFHALQTLKRRMKIYVTSDDKMCYDHSELSAVPGLRE